MQQSSVMINLRIIDASTNNPSGGNPDAFTFSINLPMRRG